MKNILHYMSYFIIGLSMLLGAGFLSIALTGCALPDIAQVDKTEVKSLKATIEKLEAQLSKNKDALSELEAEKVSANKVLQSTFEANERAKQRVKSLEESGSATEEQLATAREAERTANLAYNDAKVKSDILNNSIKNLRDENAVLNDALREAKRHTAGNASVVSHEVEKRLALLQTVLYPQYKKLFDCASDKQSVTNAVVSFINVYGKDDPNKDFTKQKEYTTAKRNTKDAGFYTDALLEKWDDEKDLISFERLVKIDDRYVTANEGALLLGYIRALERTKTLAKGVETCARKIEPEPVIEEEDTTDDSREKYENLNYVVKMHNAQSYYDSGDYEESLWRFKFLLNEFKSKEDENPFVFAQAHFHAAKIELKLYTHDPQARERAKAHYEKALVLDAGFQKHVDALKAEYDIPENDSGVALFEAILEPLVANDGIASDDKGRLIQEYRFVDERAMKDADFKVQMENAKELEKDGEYEKAIAQFQKVLNLDIADETKGFVFFFIAGAKIKQGITSNESRDYTIRALNEAKKYFPAFTRPVATTLEKNSDALTKDYGTKDDTDRQDAEPAGVNKKVLTIAEADVLWVAKDYAGAVAGLERNLRENGSALEEGIKKEIHWILYTYYILWYEKAPYEVTYALAKQVIAHDNAANHKSFKVTVNFRTSHKDTLKIFEEALRKEGGF